VLYKVISVGGVNAGVITACEAVHNLWHLLLYNLLWLGSCIINSVRIGCSVA
jgi:hypothetical protein